MYEGRRENTANLGELIWLGLGKMGRYLNCTFHRCAWGTTDEGNGQNLSLGYLSSDALSGGVLQSYVVTRFPRGAVPGVGRRLTFPPLRPYCRGHVGHVGLVGSLFGELRARPSPAPPPLPKPDWGFVSGASRGGAEVCTPSMSR